MTAARQERNVWRALLSRLRDYARIAWTMSACIFLAALWGKELVDFCLTMHTRLGYLFGTPPRAVDIPCSSPQCDFSAFWPAGVLARTHQAAAIYDPGVFAAKAGAMLPPHALVPPFFYPPFLLLPVSLTSWLPFESAFFVWTAVLAAAAVALLRWAGLSWRVVALTLLSPAALWNFELGQLGLIGGAVLVAGLLMLGTKPLRAGAALGLLACKPQFGLLVPAALLGGRSWRGAAGFAAAICGLASISWALFGLQAWRAYLAAGHQTTMNVLSTPFAPALGAGDGVSIFWMLRSLGADLPVAFTVQGVCALAAMLAAVYVWSRRDLARLDQAMLTIGLSLLATPYGYGDDMVAWSALLAMRAERRAWRIGLLDALFWTWPQLCQAISFQTGILWTPVIVLLALARGWHEARRPAVSAPA